MSLMPSKLKFHTSFLQGEIGRLQQGSRLDRCPKQLLATTSSSLITCLQDSSSKSGCCLRQPHLVHCKPNEGVNLLSQPNMHVHDTLLTEAHMNFLHRDRARTRLLLLGAVLLDSLV